MFEVPGLGSCTDEHLELLLDDTDTMELLFEAITSLARAKMPVEIAEVLIEGQIDSADQTRGVATGRLSWPESSPDSSRERLRRNVPRSSMPCPLPHRVGTVYIHRLDSQVTSHKHDVAKWRVEQIKWWSVLAALKAVLSGALCRR